MVRESNSYQKRAANYQFKWILAEDFSSMYIDDVYELVGDKFIECDKARLYDLMKKNLRNAECLGKILTFSFKENGFANLIRIDKDIDIKYREKICDTILSCTHGENKYNAQGMYSYNYDSHFKEHLKPILDKIEGVTNANNSKPKNNAGKNSKRKQQTADIPGFIDICKTAPSLMYLVAVAPKITDLNINEWGELYNYGQFEKGDFEKSKQDQYKFADNIITSRQPYCMELNNEKLQPLFDQNNEHDAEIESQRPQKQRKTELKWAEKQKNGFVLSI